MKTTEFGLFQTIAAAAVGEMKTGKATVDGLMELVKEYAHANTLSLFYNKVGIEEGWQARESSLHLFSALRAYAERLAAKSEQRWIPVEVSMPMLDEPVLGIVACKSRPMLVMRIAEDEEEDEIAPGWQWGEFEHGDIWSPINYFVTSILTITHWQPLPAPPEVKT